MSCSLILVGGGANFHCSSISFSWMCHFAEKSVVHLRTKESIDFFFLGGECECYKHFCCSYTPMKGTRVHCNVANIVFLKTHLKT